MWDALPCELQRLVLEHRAAMVVQRAWLRYSHYAHARKQPLWCMVRRGLTRYAAWRSLIPYAGVRREWRREPNSWLLLDEEVFRAIHKETAMGLWGDRSPRLDTACT